MSNNNEREIYINISLVDIARSMNSSRARQNVMNLLFESVMEEVYIDNLTNYYASDMENKMLEIAMNESLLHYKTQEKKPGVKLGISSKLATADDKDKNCAICNSDIEIDENITLLECDHLFHTICIGEWVMYKSECPCCRSSIKTIEEEEEYNGEEYNGEEYNGEEYNGEEWGEVS